MGYEMVSISSGVTRSLSSRIRMSQSESVRASPRAREPKRMARATEGCALLRMSPTPFATFLLLIVPAVSVVSLSEELEYLRLLSVIQFEEIIC